MLDPVKDLSAAVLENILQDEVTKAEDGKSIVAMRSRVERLLHALDVEKGAGITVETCGEHASRIIIIMRALMQPGKPISWASLAIRWNHQPMNEFQ